MEQSAVAPPGNSREPRIESMLEALSTARRQAGRQEYVPNAPGWSIEWRARSAAKKPGDAFLGRKRRVTQDAYFRTPNGELLRSLLQARQWLETGSLTSKQSVHPPAFQEGDRVRARHMAMKFGALRTK